MTPAESAQSKLQLYREKETVSEMRKGKSINAAKYNLEKLVNREIKVEG